ncbi:MAG: hypothetical protein OEY09_12900 [Gammaproteobacteria bacterium]|nr:hypothetical protein [Gammaproteobacteria bacterium]
MSSKPQLPDSSLLKFIFLGILLASFVLAIAFLGYMTILFFFAIVAGFVLWWSWKDRDGE